MLANLQSQEYNRAQKLNNFFSTHGTIISTYVPFEDEVTSFNTNFTFFRDNIVAKDTSGTGITTAQKGLKAKIGIGVANICMPACAYANKYGNTKLAADMCYGKSDITKLKEGDVLGAVIRIANALSPLMTNTDFIKYEITSQMLSDVMADATLFNSNIGKASLEEDTSNIANKNINLAIKALRENIKQFDRLVNRFTATHPLFVSGYKTASMLDNTGTHHSGFEGIIISGADKKPIKQARIVALGIKAKQNGKDKAAETDLIGYYELIKMRAGDYEVTFSADGFTAKTMTLRVERGKIKKIDVTL